MKFFLSAKSMVLRTVAAMLMAVLLVVSPLFTASAQADDVNLVSIAQQFLKTVNDARAQFDNVFNDSQSTFDEGLSDLRTILKDLPDDLQRLSTEKNAATRDKLRLEIAEKQKALKTFASSFDDVIAKADTADKNFDKAISSARSTLKKALDQAQDEASADIAQKTNGLKQTLTETAKAIASLSDDATRVLNGKAFVPTRFQDELNLLNTALDGTSKLFKAFAS
jgi:uncharacterized protein YukE